MSIGSGSAQDGQELCCTSCWGYHGNFPDCERVNASPAPAAVTFGPAWHLFVWVMRPSLIVRGPLKWKNRRPILQPCKCGAKWTTRGITRRGARDKPKGAYAALNARFRTICREFSSNGTELTSKSVANYSDVNSITSRPPSRKTHRKIIGTIWVNICKCLISHLQARCTDLNHAQ